MMRLSSTDTPLGQLVFVVEIENEGASPEALNELADSIFEVTRRLPEYLLPQALSARFRDAKKGTTRYCETIAVIYNDIAIRYSIDLRLTIELSVEVVCTLMSGTVRVLRDRTLVYLAHTEDVGTAEHILFNRGLNNLFYGERST